MHCILEPREYMQPNLCAVNRKNLFYHSKSKSSTQRRTGKKQHILIISTVNQLGKP